MAITNKQVTNAALERNELLRATWQAAYADIPAEYCVYRHQAVDFASHGNFQVDGLERVKLS